MIKDEEARKYFRVEWRWNFYYNFRIILWDVCVCVLQMMNATTKSFDIFFVVVSVVAVRLPTVINNFAFVCFQFRNTHTQFCYVWLSCQSTTSYRAHRTAPNHRTKIVELRLCVCFCVTLPYHVPAQNPSCNDFIYSRVSSTIHSVCSAVPIQHNRHTYLMIQKNSIWLKAIGWRSVSVCYRISLSLSASLIHFPALKFSSFVRACVMFQISNQN